MSTSPPPRGLALAILVALGAGGCAPSVVMENPVTRQRVDCTVQAERLAGAVSPSESTGKDVPRTPLMSPQMVRFDYERQCRGNLEREGFRCVSGC